MAKSLLLGFCATLGWASLSFSADAADLDVRITDLRSDNGNVHIAIYDKPESFPDGDGMIDEVEVPVEDRNAGYTFSGLAAGEYAIAVYHDENDNDDFDTNFIGLPLEGYAFSNGATVFLGPPSFAAARITLPADGTTTEIRMTY